MEDPDVSQNETAAPSEPVFNLPGLIVGLAALLIGIHALRIWVLDPQTDLLGLFMFAFWPVRYLPEVASSAQWPGGFFSGIYSFVTYAFLHGSWTHVIFNVLWMAIFGTALARRFGTGRFLLFSVLTAIAGAGAHLITHWGDQVPVIGASAAISAYMAGAIRFVFDFGGPLGVVRAPDSIAYRLPARPLAEALRNPQVLGFTIAWFGINLLFGLWSTPLAGEGSSIAWEAHVGGFVAGLLLFPVFDPVPRHFTPST
ncbi:MULTISPECIES: rhomboid family intramembrane serine protease [Pseudovibrio]|uniref:rhomboid family intramembrane serine protease n=1 Tax=Stappiaceae TaxID=2821832 RepID=UPI002365318F|nr:MULTISPECIES: rhomboid family intramembrane serine protease [Pseudovibrio]MDD7910536.1 rhomboid family intramembrane serine protease [Pseudovibrio exalbescens]MDX5594615.1 rhomboid family intramembrane serine protease [Pseudovibrio sp. SPO723]